ncbi:flagellar hook-associated protein FlgK [Aurantimonas sp. A2-1-M11]|uniref:flagellar hook-associated protein FlgK n=1 Tax=Aurantimonas sp. A2-1-M11 TaxID=3113712 RepID=UPI002F926D20
MSLLSAFSNATASLSSVASQSALVSRNIANADNPYATRKFAGLTVAQTGGVRIMSIAQSGDQALFRSLITTNSALGSAEANAKALNRIREVIGDVDAPTSPAASLSALKAALSQYSVSPENGQTAEAAVNAARDMAVSLNRATDAVQSARKDADDQLNLAAKDMNRLLGEFATLNAKIMAGSSTGGDVTDAVDRRDQIVRTLSGYVGLNVQVRSGNDMALYTDSGITLFDKTARAVEFTPQPAYDATVAGYAFKIDGVVVGGPSSPMPIKGGSVYGLLTLRDETATTFQGQLDGIAYALVDAFAETDQRLPADPGYMAGRFAGLFTADGTNAIQLTMNDAKGLAGTIRIAAAVDPTKPGGEPALLRDGGISFAGTADEANFRYNTSGASGFTGRLNDLIAGFATSRSFDPSFGAGSSATLTEYTASSIGWFEGRRATANDASSYQTVLLSRTQETLSDATGVNIDDEMTRLLDLERSYQASSKLISTVGQMIDSLLAIA